MKKVVSHTPKTVMLPLRHCPRCHCGNIMRVLAEVLEEMELDSRTVPGRKR